MCLSFLRSIRRTAQGVAVAATVAGMLSVTALAQETKPRAAPPKDESLARYVPGEGLIVLFDHEGFDSRPDAWKDTAAHKLLSDTALGAMFEDIAAQLADRGLQAVPDAPVNGKDVVALLSHMASRGFALGFCGSLNPPQPRAGVVVIRDAGRNEAFQRVLKRLEPLSKPVEPQNGRKSWAVEGAPLRWWLEGDDAVLSFAPPGAVDPVAETLDGRSPSALKNPAVVALAKAEPGVVPIGLLLVDLAGMPPLPPQAARVGLDGIRRVEGRWGIQGKAMVGTLGVHAPRPRRGVLALFDQPPLGAGTRFATPKGVTDYTLLSVDPAQFADAFLAVLKQNDPDSAAGILRFARDFQGSTGVSLRADLLAKVGPRMGILVPESGGFGNVIAMWFNPPDLGIVAELKDAKGFEATLDRLVEVANLRLKAAGALVPPRAGRPVRPGTAFAELRRLKPPEHGYVLAIPPSVLPTPAGLRPTVLIDTARGRIALAGSLAAARRVLPALVLDEPGTKAVAGRDALLFSQSDPSAGLPEFLVNIPSLVQFFAFAAAQSREPGLAAKVPFRLEFDPEAIPDVAAIRPHLFPSRFTLAADADSIRLTSSSAFPLPVPQLNAGMESPVLIALLLPAVQAAREAARRAQCVNNLKQIGLSLHNYHAVNGTFPPPALSDRAGKPLLSWRVALLPYLDQQALYNEFHLDEPWDSAHNKTLIERMPKIFACPSRSSPEPGTTTYRAFTGPGTVFGQARGTTLDGVTDGLSRTLAMIEAAEAVVWTRPEGLPFTGDGEAALALAGSDHPGGFNALFVDGSVRFLKRSIAANVFKSLLTVSGGEAIDVEF